MGISFHNPAAMAPFFDETIVVEGVRPGVADGTTRTVKGTFKACVFDNGLADPFADADAESNVRTFSISVRARDWIERTPPQTGDRISIDRPGITFKLAVSRVDSVLGDTWTCTAKEAA